LRLENSQQCLVDLNLWDFHSHLSLQIKPERCNPHLCKARERPVKQARAESRVVHGVYVVPRLCDAPLHRDEFNLRRNGLHAG